MTLKPSRRSARVFAAVLILGAGAYLACGCGRGSLRQISLAIGDNTCATLIRVADARGMLRENGLRVKTRDCSQARVIQALAAGEADIAVVGEFELVRAFLNGHSIKLIAAIASQNDTQFVASRDSGITVEVDIRDKRVAVEPDGREEYMLDRFLTINGLSRKDLDVRHMASSDAANAMLSGSIDAAMLHDTYAYAITTKMGTRCVSWPGQEGLSDYSVLITSSEFAEKHKPEIKSIFKALREAEQYVEKEPEQAMKVAKISNLGERVEAERWQNMDVRLELEQALLLTMDYEAQWLSSRGYGEGNIPSTYRLLDMAGLEEVSPSSVTVTH